MNKKKKVPLLICLIFMLGFTSCLYRMPTEDDPDIVPTTNHPDVTREKSGNWMPGIQY